MNRRRFLIQTPLATTTAALGARLAMAEQSATQGAVEGRVNHSVCKWCYPKISLEALCEAGSKMGLRSVEIIRPNTFETLKKYGMTCGMVANPQAEGPHGKKVGGITNAWNRTENHDALVEAYLKDIPILAEAGVTNLICFSGNRRGMDDQEGLANCAQGLKRILGAAEKHNVKIVMELLNSKVNHKDYMCDRTHWGVALCKEIGSENFQLLYDIYHMQVQEGDVIATIKDAAQYIAHYHTAGVPGRHEIDDTQELNYPAIMNAIVATGYEGFVAQEFLPQRDPLTSLEQAINICNV